MSDGNDCRITSLCGWRGIDAIQQAFASQMPALALPPK